MKKPGKSPKKTKKKAKTKEKKYFVLPLVSNQKVNAFAVVLGSDGAKEKFKKGLKNFTGSYAAEPDSVDLTPQNRHLALGPNNQCGKTPGGSVLIYSPSQHLSVEVITPAGKNRETISLCLLRREQDRQPKSMSAVHQILQNKKKISRESIAATATKKTRDSQPKRKTQRSEKSAVGKSAKELVIDYFQKQGVEMAASEIEKPNWNLCHLLSYAIAKNAKDVHGGEFDTQVFDNLFSGSRAFNENMMRIENVLLKMLSDNAVKEIRYMAIHSEFENSHILSELTLEVDMLTHDNRRITFSHLFDVADSRKYAHENSTAYYVLLKSIIDGSAKKEQKAEAPPSVTTSSQTFFKKKPKDKAKAKAASHSLVNRKLF